MSEQIKELLKKDIVKIATLSLGMDYTEKEEIEKLYEVLLATHPFYTNFGNRYLDRLQAILKEDDIEHKCVLCGKDSGENPVLCNQCLEEIPVKEEPVEEENVEEEFNWEENIDEEHFPEESAEEEFIPEEVVKEEVVQEDTIQDEIIASKEIKKIVQPEIDDTVENAENDIEEIVENDSAREKAIDSKIYSRRLYLLYSVIVILLIVIFKLSIVGDVENDKKNEFSAAQAKKVVEEFYDKTNYKISLQEVSECPKAIFEASKGKQVPQEAWLSSELIGVYTFSIADNKENILGQVWVSFQGNAVQLGMTENEKFIVLKEN